MHEFDLIECDSEESAERLYRYLNYESLKTGEAVKKIEEDYRNVSKQRQVEGRLPEAWSNLLQDEDEFLLESMVDKTESLCGTRPTTEQVLTFLKSLKRVTESDWREKSQSNSNDEKQERSSTYRNRKQKKPATTLIVTMPDGKVIDHHDAAQTFVEVIVKEVIANSDQKKFRVFILLLYQQPRSPLKKHNSSMVNFT